MATTLQLNRGTTAEAAAFTGAEGELFVDTDNNIVYIHDGTTAGGHRVSGDLSTFVSYYEQADAPVLGDGVNEGDIWKDTDTGTLYMASIDAGVLTWFGI